MTTKRMRLPNGFGQISKINNARLRNPYRVMITVGKTDEGRPICKILKPQGYFRTYNEAYGALMQYNKRPYELDGTTLQDAYTLWSDKYKMAVNPSRFRSISASWKRAAPIHSMLIRDIRPKHIRRLLDDLEGKETANIQSLLKQTLNMVFDYAVEHGLTDQNSARECKPVRGLAATLEKETTSHIAFNADELNVLWAHAKDPCIRAILIQCYSGWRPDEFLSLRPENINRENLSFTGGSKTECGRNRVVPIHSKIQSLVNDAFNDYDYRMFSGEYRHYLAVFHRTMGVYGLNTDHRPHDARKTFVTLAKQYNVNEYAIKRIVGHRISDLTERVYTERDYAWLKAEIEKIK